MKEYPEIPSKLIKHFQKSTNLSPDINLVKLHFNRIAIMLVIVAPFIVSGIIMPVSVHAEGSISFIKSVIGVVSGKSHLAHNTDLPLLRAAVNTDPNIAKGGADIGMVGGVALIANGGPVGTLADVESVENHGQISTYVVKEGDSLSQIANMFGVSVNTIIWANGLKSRTISPGQELVILPVSGVRYTVKKGDTLSSIAKKYSGDAEEISIFNEIPVSQPLAVGSVVIIPNGEMGSTVIATKSSKTTTTSSSGSKERLWGTGGPDLGSYFAFPVPGAIVTQLLHGYDAVDLAAPIGTKVYAAAPGRVIISRFGGWNGGYGNYIVIAHPNGTQTLYGHLSANLVSQGDIVSRGDLIGRVGSTGNSTGPHTHFEVRGAKNPFGDCKLYSHCGY